jgi:XTP/dITP diphosphohydrolase
LTKLYCATGNMGKLREFRYAAQFFPRFEIDLMPGYADLPKCEENAATFGENAILKAQHYAPHVEGLLFADDSGLMVEALDGAPGVYSARFSGPNATDESNNRMLLEKLKGVEDRRAAFVCTIALMRGSRSLGIFAGRVNGVILEEPRGGDGFGYDPLFFVPDLNCTFGEATEEQKFAYSHRGNALRMMLKQLMRG